MTTTQFFKNCNIKNVGFCVEVKPSPRPGYVGATGLSFVDCIFDGLNARAVRLTDTSNVAFVNCWFEGRLYPTLGAVIEATGSYEGLSIVGCRFVQILYGGLPESRHLYAIRIAGVGRSVLVSHIVVVLGTNTAPDDPPPPYHVVIEPPAPGGPGSEVVVLGGSLRDTSGLEDEVHRALRISAGSPKTTLLGTMWRARLPQLGVSERNLLRQPTPGDMIYNSDLNRLEYYNGTEWRYVSSGPVP
ncbi:MAG: hypothetical protein HZC42_11225 [Candidatus Eisenbacteria bacterium]|nr:hypothetical protein [Candidatus Eisenbacteria bacterium]